MSMNLDKTPIITTPAILTDTIFTTYGGYTGTATAAQVNAAYCIAETQAGVSVGTPLVPTSITGTYFHLYAYGQPMSLPYNRIHSLDTVVLQCSDWCTSCTVEDHTECGHIKSHLYGIIELRLITLLCAVTCATCSRPLMWRVEYTAGLEAGIASTAPNMLLALTMAAQIALEQITDPHAAEGGAGDAGVQAWRSMSYSETRVKLLRTAFGTSARANYIQQLLQPWRLKRAIKLGYR